MGQKWPKMALKWHFDAWKQWGSSGNIVWRCFGHSWGALGHLEAFLPVSLHLRQTGSFWALHVSKMPQGWTACLILVFSSLVCWFMTKNSKKKVAGKSQNQKREPKMHKNRFFALFSKRSQCHIFSSTVSETYRTDVSNDIWTANDMFFLTWTSFCTTVFGKFKISLHLH